MTVKQTNVDEGIVNSINETIQLPAGVFTTLMITTVSPHTVHKEWVDIASGHSVRIEEYDEDGVTLRWILEATLVQ